MVRGLALAVALLFVSACRRSYEAQVSDAMLAVKGARERFKGKTDAEVAADTRELIAKGVVKLSDERLIGRAELTLKLLEAAREEDCAKLTRGNADGVRMLELVSKLPQPDRDAFLALSRDALDAELNGRGEEASEYSAGQYATAVKELIERLPDAEQARLTANLSRVAGLSNAEACWTGRTMFRGALAAPEGQRPILARVLALPAGYKPPERVAPPPPEGEDHPMAWTSYSGDGKVTLSQRPAAQNRCEVECKLGDGTTAWKAVTDCLCGKSERRFVSKDCERTVVLFAAPDRASAWNRTVTMKVFKRDKLEYPVMGPGVLRDEKLRRTSPTWVKGTYGVPGEGPRYSESGDAVLFESIDGKKHEVALSAR